MRATAFEFRFRFAIITTVYFLGFLSPWLIVLHRPHQPAWPWLAGSLSSTGLFTFSNASALVTAAMLACTLLGAALRFWATACLGARTVHSHQMHAIQVMDAGPFAYTRNPLYLGSFFTLLGVSTLMPVSGMIFANLAYIFFITRIVLSEQAYLTQEIGQPYLDYCNRVPALFPTLHPQPSTLNDLKPEWLLSLRDEFYGIGIALSFAVLAWQYNSQLLIQAILINFGLFLIVRAIFPPPKHTTNESPQPDIQ
jgi:protein-S-isoprenylcysteine O-methyltransferase Ste14